MKFLFDSSKPLPSMVTVDVTSHQQRAEVRPVAYVRVGGHYRISKLTRASDTSNRWRLDFSKLHLPSGEYPGFIQFRSSGHIVGTSEFSVVVKNGEMVSEGALLIGADDGLVLSESDTFTTTDSVSIDVTTPTVSLGIVSSTERKISATMTIRTGSFWRMVKLKSKDGAWSLDSGRFGVDGCVCDGKIELTLGSQVVAVIPATVKFGSLQQLTEVREVQLTNPDERKYQNAKILAALSNLESTAFQRSITPVPTTRIDEVVDVSRGALAFAVDTSKPSPTLISVDVIAHRQRTAIQPIVYVRVGHHHRVAKASNVNGSTWKVDFNRLRLSPKRYSGFIEFRADGHIVGTSDFSLVVDASTGTDTGRIVSEAEGAVVSVLEAETFTTNTVVDVDMSNPVFAFGITGTTKRKVAASLSVRTGNFWRMVKLKDKNGTWTLESKQFGIDDCNCDGKIEVTVGTQIVANIPAKVKFGRVLREFETDGLLYAVTNVAKLALNESANSRHVPKETADKLRHLVKPYTIPPRIVRENAVIPRFAKRNAVERAATTEELFRGLELVAKDAALSSKKNLKNAQLKTFFAESTRSEAVIAETRAFQLPPIAVALKMPVIESFTTDTSVGVSVDTAEHRVIESVDGMFEGAFGDMGIVSREADKQAKNVALRKLVTVTTRPRSNGGTAATPIRLQSVELNFKVPVTESFSTDTSTGVEVGVKTTELVDYSDPFSDWLPRG